MRIILCIHFLFCFHLLVLYVILCKLGFVLEEVRENLVEGSTLAPYKVSQIFQLTCARINEIYACVQF